MVAYSFQKQFVPAILDGSKAGTIRAVGKRRHAQPGDALQLYSGMRTKHCRLIARATCRAVDPIRLRFIGVVYDRSYIETGDGVSHGGRISGPYWLDQFARADGFESFAAMKDFWLRVHRVREFNGLHIKWRDVQT